MDTLFTCDRILVEKFEREFELIPGGILVSPDGKIAQIFRTQEEINSYIFRRAETKQIHYGANLVLMPGVVDSHVHVNDPGRTDWESFATATKNSIPPTTTLVNLKTKINAAKGNIYVNVGFWGGVIPGNDRNLIEMVHHGVVGFKCFLCPSGVEEFPHVTIPDLKVAMEKLNDSGTVLAFHAEVEGPATKQPDPDANPKVYDTFLSTRPDEMEVEAIDSVCKLAKEYNLHVHIVHLSTAKALPIIEKAKQDGVKLTVETCHHYLTLESEGIPDGHTEFKCCPPIRNAENRRELWQALKTGLLDLVVSDHSPSTPGKKLLIYNKNRGNFVDAWGGIASVQFGLSLFWTNCQEFGLTLGDMCHFLCRQPAKLCGFEREKGRIEVGYDADFVVFDPDADFAVSPDIIQFMNKATPYLDRRLKGVVHATIVGGLVVFEDGRIQGKPMGNILLRRDTRRRKSGVKFSA